MFIYLNISWNFYFEIQKTPLYAAIEQKNTKIIQLLLERQDLDLNEKSIGHYNSS